MTTKITMLAIDLAKGCFQVCAVGPDGAVIYNRARSRTRLAAVLAEQPACVVAMEACATAPMGPGSGTARPRGAARPGSLREAVRETPEERSRGRGRRRGGGHAPDHALRGGEERRDPGSSSGVPDAPMPCPAAHAAINALRGHLAESGLVAPKGPASLKVLENALADETTDLPSPVRDMGTIYLEQIERLTGVIERLAEELEEASKTDAQLRRLCTIPGIGPVTAGAVAAFAPDLDTFDSGRNFAAWLGPVPRQRSTGGKTRLGSVSKMGQTDIRRLLVVGAPLGSKLCMRLPGTA